MGKATEPSRATVRRGARRRRSAAQAATPLPADQMKAAGKVALVAPPPEQIKRFQLEGVGKERRYKRVAYIEALAISPRSTSDPKGPRMLTRDQHLALRTYREKFDATQASLTRCALDVQGGRGAGRDLPPTMVTAWLVRLADEAMGAVGDTVRAVVLHDMDFSAAAMLRFGSRTHTYQKGKNGPMRTREVPRSGRHREIIRDEFLLGVDRLERALRPHLRTGE